MTFTFNDFLRYAKKAFKFYKKWQKSQQQQQQGQQHQQGGYPQQSQQGGHQQSPYPATHQGQSQGGAWNNNSKPHQQQQQGGYAQGGGGGYGSHDGPATLPRAVMELILLRLDELERLRSLSLRTPIRTPLPPTSTRPFLSSYSLNPLTHLSPSSLLHRRPFTTLPPHFARNRPHVRHPFRPPIISPPPPAPPPQLLTIFNALPPWLRPSPSSPLLTSLSHLSQQNQDMANAQNSHYVELRNKAIREGDLMGQAFSASKQAYSSGDGGRAHDLSTEGKEHQRLKEQYNDEAAAWIYNENNKVQPRGTIDLHGLYVQESIEFTERAINESRQQGLSELRVIVGKGNHSASHVAKIKPAITSLMERQRLTAALDQHNSGVLIVQLQGQGGKGSREIIGDLEKDDGNDCVIM